MNSFAATTLPVAAPAIPIEWITSGVMTPVNAVASPAASMATAWSPQPAFADPSTSNAAIRDAVLSSMGLGMPATQPQVQLQQQQLAMTASASGPVQQFVAPPAISMEAAGAAIAAAPPGTTMPSIAAAPAPVAAAPQGDPTLVSSVAGAVAGFASATGRVVGAAAGAGVSTARRVGSELWAGVRNPKAIHVSQVPSRYNTAPAAGNRDCGPASVVMTLKLLGKKIPGVGDKAAPQRLINRVRQLAGNAANTVSTTNHDLERALNAAGAKTREIADAVSIRQAVLSGKPVILNGNPRHAGAYGPKFSAKQMAPYNGAHWIVVSGLDEKSGKFIINDPLSKIGPVKVTAAQLEAYRGGSLGIEVEA